MTVLDEIVQDQLRTDLPELATGDTVSVSRQGRRGQPRADPGLRGDRHAPARRRHHPLDHGPPDRQRRRCRAHVQGQQPADREDRGHAPRQVRRAQLYFLRDRVGKAATLRERRPKAADSLRQDLDQVLRPGGADVATVARRTAAAPTAAGPTAATAAAATPARAPIVPPDLPPRPTGGVRRSCLGAQSGGRPRPRGTASASTRTSSRTGLSDRGYRFVAGVDEVGRGACRAGRRRRGDHPADWIPGVRDSKTLCSRSASASPRSSGRSGRVGGRRASVREIDRSTSTTRPISRCAAAIAARSGHDHVLVDGNRIAGFEAHVGPYTQRSSTATRRSTRSPARRSSPRSSATG